jgi:hypothetical protein
MTFTVASNSFKDGDYLPSDFLFRAISVRENIQGGPDDDLACPSKKIRLANRRKSYD